MKIEKISKEPGGVFVVEFSPVWLEKIFGVKPTIEKFKDSGSTYMSGGGHVYIQQDGSQLSNSSYIGNAIDNWRRKF